VEDISLARDANDRKGRGFLGLFKASRASLPGSRNRFSSGLMSLCPLLCDCGA